MRRSFGTGILVAVLATLGAALGPAPSACACSCAPGTKAEYEQRSDMVFVGVADSEVTGATPKTVFTVESVVKGSASGQVSVYSIADNEAACGIRFTVGARYEVYVRRDGDRLTTNLCAGNRLLDRSDRRPVESVSGQSWLPAESVRDFGPAAPWPVIAGWGVAGLGVLALSGLWLGARRRRSRSGNDV